MWIFCFLLISPIAIVQKEQIQLDMQFNPANIVTFKGEVLDVQIVHFVNRPAPYIQLILKTDEGEFSIEVAPEWYLQTQGMIIIPKDRIEVVGSVILINGKPLVVAAQINGRSGNVQLRDGNGNPLW